MKKFRLKEDTVLYPKGTEARKTDHSCKYQLVFGWVDYDTDIWFYPWQVENNSLWEEITEDQREERAINMKNGSRIAFSKDNDDPYMSSEDQYTLRKKQKQFGDVVHQSMVASIHSEYDSVDHQALREESIRNIYLVDSYMEIRKDGLPMLTIGVHPQYADAWRSLLDKKEG